jgi:hypothetical protein
MSRIDPYITLRVTTLVGGAFLLITSTATATFTITKIALGRAAAAVSRVEVEAAAPAATRGTVERVGPRSSEVLSTGEFMTPVLLSRTIPPMDIGHFKPTDRKCSMDVNTGAVTLAITDRSPGTYAGCCLPLSRAVDVYPGTIARFDFSLAQDDRIDLKFEGGTLGSNDRTTALLIGNELIRSTESAVTRMLTGDGRTPLRDTIVDVTRVCVAIVGEDGPSPNSLTINSVLMN